MLKLTQIKKHYVTGGSTVEALRGVDLEFRKSEFVSVLGQSGCGKTTLLNIIGGLDRYTSGDLVINGKSTKTFKDSDWDSYRNHSIGFVFQSYNLIPHQTVLSNVELALTLSGVSKKERRQRAIHALEQVGLGDQIHKKPNQMSGGQMQRVAIARALVNDPEILLADEPTGALDTATSVQIMEILKEISKDRLIIMVTHNPELAETYSTRIIKLLDGLVIDDTDPYTAPVEDAPIEVKNKKKKKEKTKKTSMSFFTALSLSLNNLATKKGRTIMTSFAGSIGIIGIALILALSSGINLFIEQVQEDTLSTYPLSIQGETQDMSALLATMTDTSNGKDYSNTNKIYVDNSMGKMLSAMSSTVKNDLTSFKEYLDANYGKIEGYVSDVQYTYDYNFQIYNLVVDEDDGKLEARKVGMETIFDNAGDAFSGMSELMEMGGSAASMNVFQEMIDNQELLNQQYEIVDGDWPKSANEVVLVVNGNNQISRMTLYMLGILDPDNIEAEMEEVLGGALGSTSIPGTDASETESESESDSKQSTDEEEYYDFDFFVGMKFMLLTHDDFYVIDESKGTYEYPAVNGKKYPIWSDVREDPSVDIVEHIKTNGTELTISGIIRPKDGATATSISGAVGYTHELTDLVLGNTAKSDVINQQHECYDEETKTGVNVLTGLPFERTHYTPETIHELISRIPPATMDIFYAYMTEQILKNEDFADRINVEDRESFIGVFMLLPEEEQIRIFEKVLNYANTEENNASVNALCQLIVGINGGDLVITDKNIVKLLPILSPGSSLLALNGIASLTDIVGEEDMNAIYKKINDNHSEGFSFMGTPMGPATAQNFIMILNLLPAKEKTEILGEIVDMAIEKDKTSVDTLCSIISSTAGEAISSENLKEKLPTMQMNALGLAFSGIKGLISLAAEEDMKEVYADTHETLMGLEVNEDMFLLILGAMTKDDPAFITMEETLYNMAPQIDETYDSILEKLDNKEKATPSSINFYAKDFESKEHIESFIKEYNDKVNKEYKDAYKAEHGKLPEDDSPKAIQYSDLVGALMSSVTTIVNVISYVLIAFVAISLVVSSIMIGIITNISVLERTKEIGILRAIGASKKDVSRVFNAETVIIGFCAGLFGVLSTSILCVPVTLILRYITGFSNITAYVPFAAGVILVVISVLLTMIAGIIPARSAAKKDPVIALRTE